MYTVDKPTETVAMRFNKALAIRGMTQKDVIDRTGLSSASLSQYSKGVYTPKHDRIILIAKALNVSEVWLMGYDVPMDRPEKLNNVDTDSMVDCMINDDSHALFEVYNKLNPKKQNMLLEFAKNLLEI